MNHRWILRSFLFLASMALLVTFSGASRRVLAAPNATVSVTLSNPACVQVGTACAVRFTSVSATGSDASFARLEILVDGKLRAWVGGFFESSAYFSTRMAPNGLAVTCGLPNAGGNPNYGKSYLVAVNGYMADGTSASGSIAVFCPSFVAKIYLPLARK